jgi:hypothetical protein
MNTKARSGNSDKPNGSGAAPLEPVLTCEEYQALLFAYMSRELGDTQSILVREHIRKCDRCRAEAAEIESTLALLKSASKTEASEASHLTDERRERILRAVFHPVMDWISRHHKMVSVVLAIVALIVTFFLLWDFEIFRNEPMDEGIPIWRMFKSGDLPELVEKGLKESEGRSQESGIRGQETGDGSQGAEDRRLKTKDSEIPTPNGGDGNE